MESTFLPSCGLEPIYNSKAMAFLHRTKCPPCCNVVNFLGIQNRYPKYARRYTQHRMLISHICSSTVIIITKIVSLWNEIDDFTCIKHIKINSVIAICYS
mgnify:FL=1